MTAQTVSSLAVPVKERRKSVRQSDRYESLRADGIILLPQMRGDYEGGFQGLANSLAEVQLQAIGVAELDRPHAIEYLAFFSKIFGRELLIDDYAIDIRSKRYRIAIWGHRRTLGRLHLEAYGCSSCQEKYGEKAALRCAQPTTHPKRNSIGIEGKVFVNIDPLLALKYQMDENSYLSPSRDRIAEMLQAEWLARKALDPKLTKVAFAQTSGFGIDYVRESLKFCDLPERVRRMVREGYIKFGVSIHLGKMAEAGLAEERILRVAQLVIAGNLRVPDVEKRVRAEINSDQDINVGMFSMEEDEPEVAHAAEVRRLLTKEAITALRLEVGLLQEARRAIQNGLLEVTDVAANPEIQLLLDQGDALRKTLAAL